MLRLFIALPLLLPLAACASKFSGGSTAGFGYAANDAAPSYSSGSSGSYGSKSASRDTPPVKKLSKLKIPPGLAKIKADEEAQAAANAKSNGTNDKVAPKEYEDLRSAKAKAKAGKAEKRADLAPQGSYNKARKGAYRDKKFKGVRLDAIAARNVINKYRNDKGLPPLALNARLTKAAMAHSRDLARFDRISHHGSDGSDPWDRVQRTGYHAKLAAENVGTGQANLREVVKGWKNSPGHNANLLLKDATQMGIALVYDPKTEYRTFWTLVLGAPL